MSRIALPVGAPHPPPPHPLPPNENRGPELLAVIWTLKGLSLIVVVLRVWAKMIPARVLWWDDASIVMALIVSLSSGFSNCLGVKNGLGRHVYYVPNEELNRNLKWTAVSPLMNFISLFFMRMSVCLFTLRLAPKTKRWPKLVVRVAFTLNVLITLANCLAFGLQCFPFEGIWNPDIPRRCWSQEVIVYVFGVTSILATLLDFLTIGVPLSLVYAVKINRRQKIGIMVIIGLGLITAACSIGKFIYTVVISIEDPTWGTLPVTIWSSVEESGGIMVASLPALRLFFSRFFADHDTRDRERSSVSYFQRLRRRFGTFPSILSRATPSRLQENSYHGQPTVLNGKQDILISLNNVEDPHDNIQRHQTRKDEDLMITLHDTKTPKTFYEEDGGDSRWDVESGARLLKTFDKPEE
ncbi:MAG: hypothetical protein M1828_004395 [Chrysothrix sp. TS-e1954]|nr:MAG: hypothetical protein M1828_004395 [Chrysothrix sp. TS-e1954]